MRYVFSPAPVPSVPVADSTDVFPVHRKRFDSSAPIGPITPVAQAGDIEHAEIYLQVNGQDRQRSNVSRLIWTIGETIEHLSAAWELQPGDLIYSGTPEGVAAVVAGDTMVAGVQGLGTLTVEMV